MLVVKQYVVIPFNNAQVVKESNLYFCLCIVGGVQSPWELLVSLVLRSLLFAGIGTFGNRPRMSMAMDVSGPAATGNCSH